MVTSHHDPDRCFPETAADGPVPVLVSGAWLPRSLFGRFLAVCAYLRMIWAALYVVFAGPEADVYFCDQVSILRHPSLSFAVPNRKYTLLYVLE